jgi:hypothetical protein
MKPRDNRVTEVYPDSRLHAPLPVPPATVLRDALARVAVIVNELAFSENPVAYAVAVDLEDDLQNEILTTTSATRLPLTSRTRMKGPIGEVRRDLRQFR